MDKITHKVRCEQWTAIINECLANGMPKTTWYRANGISEKQFFYWQRILRQEAYQQMESQSSSPASSALVLNDKKEPSSHPAFVEIHPDAIPEEKSPAFRPNVITKQVMANWVIRCSERYLSPVYFRLHELLLKYDVTQQDETPVEVSKDGRRTARVTCGYIGQESIIPTESSFFMNIKRPGRQNIPKDFWKDFTESVNAMPICKRVRPLLLKIFFTISQDDSFFSKISFKYFDFFIKLKHLHYIMIYMCRIIAN